MAARRILPAPYAPAPAPPAQWARPSKSVYVAVYPAIPHVQCARAAEKKCPRGTQPRSRGQTNRPRQSCSRACPVASALIGGLDLLCECLCICLFESWDLISARTGRWPVRSSRSAVDPIAKLAIYIAIGITNKWLSLSRLADENKSPRDTHPDAALYVNIALMR